MQKMGKLQCNNLKTKAEAENPVLPCTLPHSCSMGNMAIVMLFTLSVAHCMLYLQHSLYFKHVKCSQRAVWIKTCAHNHPH